MYHNVHHQRTYDLQTKEAKADMVCAWYAVGQMVGLTKKPEEGLPAEKEGVTTSTGPQVNPCPSPTTLCLRPLSYPCCLQSVFMRQLLCKELAEQLTLANKALSKLYPAVVIANADTSVGAHAKRLHKTH